MAESIYTLVRVRFLSVKATIVFDVFEGLGWKASVTSKIVECLTAVNKLLFRKRDGLASCLGICSLKCTSSAVIISIKGI